MHQRFSVLITGAGSGIGRATARYLSRQGFIVFAAVRSKKDLLGLEKIPLQNTHPLLMDVTDAKSIERACEEVSIRLNGSGLNGLINNAGTILTGPLEYVDLNAFRRQLEVNVTGQLAVIQAFLPLLKKTRGRVVNIGSASGLNALPLIGPYSASKFALEALTDTLRMELAHWGVHVVLIEPGSVNTPIMRKGSEAIERNSRETKKTLQKEYGGLITSIRAGFRASKNKGTTPETVARVIEKSLLSPHPKTRYLVGKIAYLRALLQKLPDRLRDQLILFGLRKKLIG
ncbi:MAG: SDR family oxidoreductase [Candidatus Omnitrophica bacterium]|nr:SDR family oxidoreductase [Candidatus Omnitrophota bacterium]